MSMWQMKAYWLPGDTCPIQDWYRAQDMPVQAEFDAALGTLAAIVDWTDTKSFGVLKRDHAGLGEIRFALEGPEKSRFRPVGIWPPIVEGEFHFTAGLREATQRRVDSRECIYVGA
jgi:hypothetical protein